MHTQSSDVGSGLTAHPENTKLPLVVELVQFALVNSSDTELALDGGDERRSLEKGTGERLKSSGNSRAVVLHAEVIGTTYVADSAQQRDRRTKAPGGR